jgi:hypothetical protein
MGEENTSEEELSELEEITVIHFHLILPINKYNLITAFSTLSWIYPIHLALFNEENHLAFIIGWFFMFSFIFYLMESHRHGMGMFFQSKDVSEMLMTLTFISMEIMLYNFIDNLYIIFKEDTNDFIRKIGILVSLFLFLLLSEIKLTSTEGRAEYIIYRMIWNGGLSLLIEKILETSYSFACPVKDDSYFSFVSYVFYGNFVITEVILYVHGLKPKLVYCLEILIRLVMKMREMEE